MMTRAWAIGLVTAVAIWGCGAPEPPVAGAPGADAPAPVVDPDSIRPFTIQVPEDVLVDLRGRIARTRYPDEVGDDWTYGTDLAYLRELLAYWHDGFDWRDQESRLNAFDQYKTRIDGLDIHFIHQRSPEPNALPLLITHGWPSSFAEFSKIIGPLTDPVAHGGRAEDAFHVVAPSVPGFGFSDKPSEPGFGPERIADVNAELMARLGYERYGAQGGDFGSFISRWLTYRHAPHVVGLHLNYLTGGPPPGEGDATALLSSAELERMQAIREFMAERSGYQAIQGTKPQTLGYALNDSPAGLASWLLQIFRWCDCAGDIEAVFTKDEVLTNATIYWVTQTITSSTRLYYEVRHAPPSGPLGRVEVPTARPFFRSTSPWCPDRGPRRTTTSRAGRRWHMAGTSPRSSSRRRSSTTSAPSSVICGCRPAPHDPQRAAARCRACLPRFS